MEYLIAILAALTLFGGVAHAKVKLGYVDVQRAILQADEGKKRYKELEQLKNKRQKEIDALKAELNKIRDRIAI